MEVINLPNGESFKTENVEAADFILAILYYKDGDDGTMAGYDALNDEVKEVVDRFLTWNEVYEDKENGFLFTKENLVIIWKGSGYDMTFDEFLEKFYSRVEP